MGPLTLKLEHFVRMSAEDREILDGVAAERQRQFRPREDILREGEAPRHVCLLLSGWACRYKQLEDGRRQIVAFFLPGDLCDLNVYILSARTVRLPCWEPPAGPPVRLAPRAAETLALASHELASNAEQHGALGRGRGRVRVSRSVAADGMLDFKWHESGATS